MLGGSAKADIVLVVLAVKVSPAGFMKFLIIAIIAVLVSLIASYAVQTRARLTFPDYDKINKIDEFYFAGDFRSPSACEEGLAYFRALPGQTAQPARCRYAPRYYVWALMAQYVFHRLAAWVRVLSVTQKVEESR